MRKVKQGHTRWIPVVYDPNTYEGYPNEYLLFIYPCRVTKVVNKTIYYSTDDSSHYLCGEEWWRKNTYPSYNKALRNGKIKLHNKVNADYKKYVSTVRDIISRHLLELKISE